MKRLALALALCPLVVSAQQAAQQPAQQPAQQATQQRAKPPVNVRFHDPRPFDFNDHAGFVQIFDGKSLSGWDGDPAIWRVEDGAIVGESTSLTVRPPNTYISYHGKGPGAAGSEDPSAMAHDFDLKLEVKVEHGGGTGIQYRGAVGQPWIRARPGQPLPKPAWLMTGPQADFWFPVDPQHEQYSGQFYSENTTLGILTWRGQVTQSTTTQDGESTNNTTIGTIGDRNALGGYVRDNGWNQYEIIARGPVMMHILNGQLMAVFIDDDPKSSNNVAGLIGIELEGTPTKISVRNIWLRKIN
jgi:hypothetical protein